MADGGKVIIKIDGDDKGFKSAMSKTKDIAGKAAKGIAVGVGAASAAIGAIGAQAVKAYADYEQLVGGVETLFKDSANIVQNYANQAYQTAGMSANQYMETVTSFSASLLQSLGGDTAKAAEYGNQAVIDMSDNANKMGTSIEMIQNAYQGFAKQNYTMLDNLKLGYGGTKEEMQRLVNDAAKLDSSIQANDLSFSNIVKSIHAVQTEMGITGTTTKEAATTIQGSLSMVKASWENLLTGMADPSQNMEVLIDNVVNSLETFANNILPRIKDTLNGMGTSIEKIFPEILNKAISAISGLLPEMAQSAVKLLSSFTSALSSNSKKISTAAIKIGEILIKEISQIIPKLATTGAQLINSLYNGIMGAMPKLGTIGTMIVSSFAANKILPIVTSLISSFKATTGAISAYSAAIATNQNISVLLASTLTPLQLAFGVLTGKISLATAAQVAWQAVMSINPIYLAVGAIAALTAGVVAASVAYDNYIEQNSEIVIATQAISDAAAESAEQINAIVDSLNNLHEQAQTTITDAEASAYANNILADELFNLAENTSLTADQKERMSAIVDQLNSSVSGLNLEFDKETGTLNKTRDAVGELIQKNLELAKVNAIQDLYTETLKEIYKAQSEAADAAQKRQEAEDQLNQILSEGIEKEVVIHGYAGKTTTYTREQQKAMKNLQEAIEAYDEELENSGNAVRDSYNNMQNLSTIAGVELPESFKTAQDSSQGYFDALKTSTDEAVNSSKSNGNDFGDGYAAGIKEKEGEAYNAGYKLGLKALQGTKDAQKSNSPSKETRKLGKFFDEGYAIGIKNNSKLAVKSASEMAEDALESIKKLTEDGRTEVQKVQDEMNKELLDSEKKYNAESERLKDSKSEADKKYLENLKNIAEQERKIYDALQKDVANSQNAIMNSIKSFAEKAYKSIEEVQKAQESYANKLKGYVSFYNSSTGMLSDYRAASEQLKLFSQALEDVQKRGNVPIGFFNELREMPIDEGIRFATALANAPDKIFNEQIDAWSEYQKEAEKVSKTLYAEEAKNAGDEVEQVFKDLNADLDQQGQDNAKAWGNGFLEKVQELMPNIIGNINAAFSGIVSGNQYAYAGAGTSNTYYSTYNIQPSSGESTQQQLWALKNSEFLKEQRGY